MLIGEVVGSVVATRKDEKLAGLTLLIVREVDDRDRPAARTVVAVDSVGAGPGDRVLFATGSAARQTVCTAGRPADAVIMAIIDSWDTDDTLIYSRQASIAREKAPPGMTQDSTP